jgi:uncharacterized protein
MNKLQLFCASFNRSNLHLATLSINLSKVLSKALSTILFGILCCFLNACQSSPTKHYYLLDANLTAEQNLSVPLNKEPIGVGPIEISDYLTRTKMFYRSSAQQLQTAENAYWAEPLSEGIVRVTQMNLMQKNPQRSFVSFPWRSDTKPHYSLRLSIQQLDFAPASAKLSATWVLFNNQTQQTVTREYFSRSLDLNQGASFQGDAMVGAYSQLLGELALELNRALDQLPAD